MAVRGLRALDGGHPTVAVGHGAAGRGGRKDTGPSAAVAGPVRALALPPLAVPWVVASLLVPDGSRWECPAWALVYDADNGERCIWIWRGVGK